MSEEEIILEMEVNFAFNKDWSTDLSNDLDWKNGEIIVTNENIWLIYNSKKISVPLKSTISLKSKNKKVLINFLKHNQKYQFVVDSNTDALSMLKQKVYSLLLHNKPIYIKHPAVVGGVVQRSVKWEKAILNIRGINDAVNIQTESKNIDIYIDDIEMIEDIEQEISKKTIKVINVAQFDGKDVYNTYIYSGGLQNILKAYLVDKIEERLYNKKKVPIKLSDKEKQILVALYSDVSSLEMDSFTGESVDKIEDLYKKLIEVGILNLIRWRMEVELSSEGRRLVMDILKTDVGKF
ncbi:MAG: CheF family chemotaxis protein [Methanosarcinales archaeon]